MSLAIIAETADHSPPADAQCAPPMLSQVSPWRRRYFRSRSASLTLFLRLREEENNFRPASELLAGLPSGIAERQRELLMQWTTLGREDIAAEILPNSDGPGNAVILSLQADHITEILVGCGEKELSSAAMIERLVKEMRMYISSGAPVGRYLADQLLLPMALAGSGRFVTMPLSSHATTNIEVIRRFLSVPIAAVSLPDGLVEVQVGR
jgi:RNA 3'-terminal phosphate cyclase (ATP)